MHRFKGPPPFLEGDKLKAARFINYVKTKAAALPRFTHVRREWIAQQGVTIRYTRVGQFWRIYIRAERTGLSYAFFVPVMDENLRVRFARALPDSDEYIAQCGLSYFDGEFESTPQFAVDYSEGSSGAGYIADRLPYTTVTGTDAVATFSGTQPRSASENDLISGSRQGYTWWFGDTLIVSESGSYPGGESGSGLGSLNSLFAYPVRSPIPSGTFDGLENDGSVLPVRGVRATYWQQSMDTLTRSASGRQPIAISEGSASTIAVTESESFKVRRVAKRTVSHETHGSRTFIIATDHLSRFRVWPEGSEADATTLTPSWPGWVHTDSTGAPYDHLEWCFNLTATKAVSLPISADVVTSSGTRRLVRSLILSDAAVTGLGLTPADYDTPKLHHPGLFEVSIDIALTGTTSGDFTAELTELQEEDELGFWPIAADYAFTDSKLSALGVDSNELIFAELRMKTSSSTFIGAASSGNGESGALFGFLAFRTLSETLVEYPLDNFGVTISNSNTVINDGLNFASGSSVGYAPWSANLGHILGVDCRALALCLTKFRADYPDYGAGQTQPSNVVSGVKLYGYGELIASSGDDFNETPSETLYLLDSADFRAIYAGAHRAIVKACGWAALRVSPQGHIAVHGDMVMGAVEGGTPAIVDYDTGLILRHFWPDLMNAPTDALSGWTDGTPVYCEGADIVAIRSGEGWTVLSHLTLARILDDINYDDYRCLFDAEFEAYRDSLPPEEASAILRGQKVGPIGSTALTGYFL